MQKYKVTCLECGESDVLTIDEIAHQVLDYDKKMHTNFGAFRWRKDMKWGFICQCGNDNRLAPSEAEDFDKLVDGDPLSIKKIAASLLVPDETQFQMEVL